MMLETAEVLWTARYDYDPGWALKVHSHDFFQAVYLIAGEGTLTLAGTRHAIEPAHMFVVAPGVRHGLEAVSRVRTLDMKFRVRDRALARMLRTITPVYCAADSGFRTLFERVWEEGNRREPLYRQMCAAHLLELLLLLGRARGAGRKETAISGPEVEIPQSDRLTATVMSFVAGNMAEPLTVRRLAGVAGCSERSLRHHFQSVVGISPLQYVTQFRIERAKSLIRDSDCALKEAASVVGFRSIHHFTRVFHRVTGMSPGSWREAQVQGIRRDINVNPGFRNVLWTVERGA